MKIYFEPESTFVVTHERKVRAIADEVKPTSFAGSLLVSHYWRDDPVQLTLRDGRNRPVTVTMPSSAYYGANAEEHLRETLADLFAAARKHWDMAPSQAPLACE